VELKVSSAGQILIARKAWDFVAQDFKRALIVSYNSIAQSIPTE
jgi:hypothetical protein